MRQHDREERMLDDVAQAIAQQILGQFLEWAMQQDEREQILADLQTVNDVLLCGAQGSKVGYRAASAAAAGLMALAATHGFLEMAEIFAGLFQGFCRTLSFPCSACSNLWDDSCLVNGVCPDCRSVRKVVRYRHTID